MVDAHSHLTLPGGAHWIDRGFDDTRALLATAEHNGRLITRMPALSPEPVVLAVFPLVSPLPSIASAAAALFDGFAGSTGLSDFPSSCISGLRPQPSLSGPPLPTVHDGP